MCSDVIDNVIVDIIDKNVSIRPTVAELQSHIDIISALHTPIVNNDENKRMLIEHICTVCVERKRCGHVGRCEATDMTVAQLNTLTALVTIVDPGDPDVGICGCDRIVTIGVALMPFNVMLGEYLSDPRNAFIHFTMCLMRSEMEGEPFMTMMVSKDYNIDTSMLK